VPDHVTLDVIDRPAGGVLRSLRQVRALRGAAPAGMRAVFALGTAHFAPLDGAEPALVLISGELHARYVAAFAKDAAGAVAHALGRPGYLGGLAINSSPLNTTSCSCWRTYQDARDYAFRPGGHLDAVRRDRARGHHRTEYFLRMRPLVERGSLAGATPFAPVLAQAVRC
jgi:hypothetical protein